MLSDVEVCTFGHRRVARGFGFDVNDKCTICECLTPPKLTCRKIHCPKIVNRWWDLHKSEYISQSIV